MATCKWCERSGWLLSLSANGMCDTCEVTEVPLIVRRVEAIQESQSIVDSAGTFQARIESCDDIIRTAEELIPYELKGISVAEPPAAELKAAYEAERERIVAEQLSARSREGRVQGQPGEGP